jgi:zinc protease
VKRILIKRLFSSLLSIYFVLSIFVSSSATQTSPLVTESVDLYGGLGLPTDTIPFMKKVRTGTLPNGLRYYILKNNKPENRAFLTLAVNAGSVLEEDNEQGLLILWSIWLSKEQHGSLKKEIF